MCEFHKMFHNYQYQGNFTYGPAPTLTKDMFITHDKPQTPTLTPKIKTQPVKSVKKLRDLPAVIKSQEKPLTGLSYVFGTSVEKFQCVLCEKSFHMNLIVGHLLGNTHRRNYCVSI